MVASWFSCPDIWLETRGQKSFSSARDVAHKCDSPGLIRRGVNAHAAKWNRHEGDAALRLELAI